MKPIINSIEWWIKRIKDSTIRDAFLKTDDYKQYKDKSAMKIADAIQYASCFHKNSELRRLYWDNNKSDSIELLDEPVYDLPEKYYVKNPWPVQYDADFAKLIRSLSNDWNGDAHYYRFSNLKIEQAYNVAPTKIPEVSYEDWKAHVLQHTGKSIPVTPKVGSSYNIGDWVCIRADQMDSLGEPYEWEADVAYKVEQATAGCVRKMNGQQCTLSHGRFRSATPEEIAKAQGTSPSPVYKSDDVVGKIAIVTNNTLYTNVKVGDKGIIVKVYYPETNGELWEIKLPGGALVFNSPNTNNPQCKLFTEDTWKVGDVLPEEWLNTVKNYRKHKGESRGVTPSFNGSRVITQTIDGWGQISDTIDIWLCPKSEYPTYNTYISTKKEVVNNQQSSLTTKTKQNVSNNSEKSSSSKESNSYNLRVYPKGAEGYSEDRGETTPAVYKVKPKVSKD